MRIDMFRPLSLLSALLCASLALPAAAQSVTAVPLPPTHPLLGTWRVDIPDTRCHETYEIRPDGSMHVTSAAQTAESTLALSLQPAATGFYKWNEQVSMQNGQADCLGQKVPVGHVATNFVILNAPATEFLMCTKEDINTCIGPFVRQKPL